MNNYVVYHLHTMDSLLDSATSFQEYVDYAVSLGQKAICFTEHGNVYNWYKKYEYCKKKGIKFLYGIECYLTETFETNIRDNYHTILIAKNKDGFMELNELISKMTLESHRYYKPRLSFEEFFGISDNIIKISACLASPLWKFMHNIIKAEDEGEDVTEKKELYYKLARHYDYYEIQYHNDHNQAKFNQLLYKMSKEFDKPLIAATDTHSLNQYKAECRMVLKYGKTDGEWGDNENELDLTYKTFDQLKEAFAIQNSLPEEAYLEAIENTNVMADSCWDFEIDSTVKYPILYEGQDEEKIMLDRIDRMYKEKVALGIIDGNDARYLNNIKEEMRVFKKINMVGFMLFMSELMCWARDEGLFTSPCRGSVGGSTVAYITDIIDVDPVKMKTVFSRFANEYREEVGDIDTDWYEDDRPKIYQHMFERFGKRKCAYILAMGTLADKAVIDTIGKAYRVMAENGGYETKYTLDFIKNIKEEWAVDQTTTRNKYPDIFKYYDGLVGCIVSQSMHPAGIVVAPLDIIPNYSVFYNKDGQQILPIDMDEVHECGLVKYDILGLKNVGIIAKTCQYANVPLPKSYSMDWTDQEVFKDMAENPTFIFQFESDYAHQTLSTYYKNKKAKGLDFTIDDLSIVNACIRPSGASYRDDLIALHMHKNPSPIIDKLLESTYGRLVFQEQTLAFLQQICGLSGGDADNVRRAIGRKQVDRLNAALPQILDGYCSKSSEPREIAESEAKEFLQIIEDSASYQFGFNHSTGYSMLGYLCGYYRHYYPLEFCTAALNCSKSDTDIQDGDKLVETLGFKIKYPKFRYSRSEYYFDKETGSIFKGVGSIKFCNATIGEELYSLRDREFDSFTSFLITVSNESSINSKQMGILIKSGFLSEFGNVNKLSNIYNMFQKVYDKNKKAFKKQMKKDSVDKNGFTHELLKAFCMKETEKTYSQVDFYTMLCTIEKTVNFADVGTIEKVKNQIDCLGSSDIYDKRYKNFACVTNIVDKRTPIVYLYAIANGNTIEVKIPRYKFDKRKLEVGDVIYIKSLKRKKKQAFNPDTGKWQSIPNTVVWWVEDYRMATASDELKPMKGVV